ncbi:MAG: hypothetical protein CVU11_14040 [Bacteroidetes bacterium HGW-Bacteroidetes-6]|jgi:hypothetical protein|nr:MAG: hypothetical protein CVU11_14040 [Bacteroidetes bacterium HGW-Bacteroidetes-6]
MSTTATLLKTTIVDQAEVVANSGNYSQALQAMREKIKSSTAFAKYFGYNNESSEYLNQCAIKAVFMFRRYKVALEQPEKKPIHLPRVIGLSFITHLTGKTAEEILKEFDEWSKTA